MTTPHGHEPSQNLLTPTALAELLSISLRHLADLRREDPTFPKPKMLGRLPRWTRTAVDEWLIVDTAPATAEDTSSPATPATKRMAARRVH